MLSQGRRRQLWIVCFTRTIQITNLTPTLMPMLDAHPFSITSERCSREYLEDAQVYYYRFSFSRVQSYPRDTIIISKKKREKEMLRTWKEIKKKKGNEIYFFHNIERLIFICTSKHRHKNTILLVRVNDIITRQEQHFVDMKFFLNRTKIFLNLHVFINAIVIYYKLICMWRDIVVIVIWSISYTSTFCPFLILGYKSS